MLKFIIPRGIIVWCSGLAVDLHLENLDWDNARPIDVQKKRIRQDERVSGAALALCRQLAPFVRGSS